MTEESKPNSATHPNESDRVESFHGRAAVLALLFSQEGHEQILLTKRTDTVDSHKGQISFPGGYWEPGDKDLLSTALRECHEEVGLGKSLVSVQGSLPAVRTLGSVEIQPYWGHLSSIDRLTLNPTEVAKVLFLPVERLLGEGLNPVRVKEGELTVETPGIWVEEELVWGATARVLSDLRDRLQAR